MYLMTPLIIIFISDMKVLSFLFAAIILFTAVVSAPVDYPTILKGVAMALNALDDKTIQSYGIDPAMLTFREELNNVFPQDILNTIRVL